MLLEWTGEDCAEIEDRFERIDEDAAIPAKGAVLVSLKQFLGERESLASRGADLGVWLASDESADQLSEAVGGELEGLGLIAIDFPIFSDGRGFSSARLLRERFGYRGEIRAIGDVLSEQVPFMIRSGFSTFEMASPKALEEVRAVAREVRVVYQPTGDGRQTAIDQRLGRKG